MSPALALAAALALLVFALLLGVLLRRREGRRRAGRALRFDPQDAATWHPGDRVTLVQFTTELCAKCPQVRRLLRSYAEQHEGVRHVEVDLTHRPDLATRYRVLQTPTTLVVGDDGAIHARFHGVPQPRALTEAVAAV